MAQYLLCKTIEHQQGVGQLSRTYCVPGTMLGTGDMINDKTDMVGTHSCTLQSSEDCATSRAVSQVPEQGLARHRHNTR